MLYNQFTILLRLCTRYKIDTLIKVLSLSLGITGCLLILLVVQHELRYDNFHSQHVQQLYYHYKSPRMDIKGAISPKPLAYFMKEHLPEVTQVVRMLKEQAYIQTGDQLTDESVIKADTNFFSLFNFPFQQGNPQTALLHPKSVVLTPASADKYFGTQDVLGKSLQIRLPEDSVFSEFVVSGLTEPIPTNTTIPFTILLPFQQRERDDEGTWLGGTALAYVALEQQAQPDVIAEKLNRKLKEELGDEKQYTTYYFQTLNNAHLGESMYGEITPPIDARYLYMAGVVALLLLLIACLNFTTLALGRSVKRAKEVGVRKTMGASRFQLIFQFFGESFLLTLAITLFSFGLAYLFLPYLSQLLQKPIAITLDDPFILLLLVGISSLAGLTAGLYPAWVLSKLSPSLMLKGQSTVNRRQRLIDVLVGLQFVGTVTLLVGSVGMHRQLELLQNKDLGFNDSYVVRLEVPFRESARLLQQFRTQVASIPDIQNVSASWQLLGHEAAGVSFQLIPFDVENKQVQAYELGVAPDFLKTTQIKLLYGRSFSHWSDSLPKQVIVNQSFVDMMGWNDPIGKRFGHEFIFVESEVIGVVQDFHFLSLHQPIGPLVIHPQHNFTNIYVRIASHNIPSTLTKLQEQWQQIADDMPFVFHFMDDDIAQQYQTEQRWADVITYTSLLVVFIACLGLFAMATLLTQQRTKEIGIRKVLGASVSSLLVLLSQDYIKLIAIAMLIAIPLANYFIQEWLSSFAYQASISWWIYGLVGLAVVLIALLTISGQTLRAARQNPVNSLRDE